MFLSRLSLIHDNKRLSFLFEGPFAAVIEPSENGHCLNQTTGHCYSVAHIEKILTVRSKRSRASGEVKEQAGRESSGRRLRTATLRPNGDGINRQ